MAIFRRFMWAYDIMQVMADVQGSFSPEGADL